MQGYILQKWDLGRWEVTPEEQVWEWSGKSAMEMVSSDGVNRQDLQKSHSPTSLHLCVACEQAMGGRPAQHHPSAAGMDTRGTDTLRCWCVENMTLLHEQVRRKKTGQHRRCCLHGREWGHRDGGLPWDGTEETNT